MADVTDSRMFYTRGTETILYEVNGNLRENYRSKRYEGGEMERNLRGETKGRPTVDHGREK